MGSRVGTQVGFFFRASQLFLRGAPGSSPLPMQGPPPLAQAQAQSKKRRHCCCHCCQLASNSPSPRLITVSSPGGTSEPRPGFEAAGERKEERGWRFLLASHCNDQLPLSRALLPGLDLRELTQASQQSYEVSPPFYK